MSILKDKKLENNDNVVKTILDKLGQKQGVEVIFKSGPEYDKALKEAELKAKYKASDIGENDTYDLIMNDYRMYKKLLILANVLRDKGLLGELSVKGGIVFSANEKVQEVLQKLADSIEDPNKEIAAFEKEAIILVTDIDERATKNMDLDNNGLEDRLEDINNNGVKDTEEKYLDPWSKVEAYRRDCRVDNMRQMQDEEYRRECQRIAREKQKEEEKELKNHNRNLLANILDD